jgi:amino acid transporter
MTWWQLGGFAYVNICGGPFGMESAVNAGGALLTLITIGVLAVCWAMPQALMTAELSTAFPVNGGLIVVRSARLVSLEGW